MLAVCAPQRILWILLLYCLRFVKAEYGSDCLTPHEEQGKCVPVRSCANILSIVENSKYERNSQHLAYARSSFCGFYHQKSHLVCCANKEIRLNKYGLEVLQNTTCGIFSFPKVAHGQQADLFAFPWMTLLKYSEGRPFRCGGTLISDRYVLTAAHCVDGLEDILTEVRLGEYDISSELDCMMFGRRKVCSPQPEDIGIEQIIKHEGYSKHQIHHDIALLRLNRTVEFQRHIGAICLPITDLLKGKVRDEYYVAGWGNTEHGGTSDVLLWTAVPHRQRSDCEMAFRLRGLTEGHICAGGLDRMDSCKGDSGGPLKQIDIYNKRGRIVQYGVVSLGIKSCGERSVPAIYTNVSHYLQWITDNISP